METSIIDDVMGFDPSSVAQSFEATAEKKSVNQNIYRTNPVNSKSEDGHYHAKIRILLNPYNIKRSIVHQARYAMRDANGFFTAISSLSDGNKECPIFKGWKKLWFAKMADPNDPSKTVPDPAKQSWARAKFDKSESDWVLVQIIEDENQPELTGQFKVMKIARDIKNRMLAKMNPTDPAKIKQPLMDYLFGTLLDLDVQPGPDDPDKPERKQREINYSLCDFDTDPYPIIKTDGTPLFDDDELAIIETYNKANTDLFKSTIELNKAATEAAKTRAQSKIDKASATKAEVVAQVKELYAKAIEYIKANAIDPVVECGYKPWTADLTDRVNNWLDKVLKLEDPASDFSVSESAPTKADGTATAPESAAPTATAVNVSATPAATVADASTSTDDDLPF